MKVEKVCLENLIIYLKKVLDQSEFIHGHLLWFQLVNSVITSCPIICPFTCLHNNPMSFDV